ncbi:hypothetical protein OPV22_006058 [Ensete ventricosum]|uniref:Uncharacterized protein n=1 Tax=Ensete ventricosum TaxID=4639 RepID=A0AAV8RKI9_ENSVE|nr:hypothetical protein OPV22_006058 [Ensete ventricosum]
MGSTSWGPRWLGPGAWRAILGTGLWWWFLPLVFILPLLLLPASGVLRPLLRWAPGPSWSTGTSLLRMLAHRRLGIGRRIDSLSI